MRREGKNDAFRRGGNPTKFLEDSIRDGGIFFEERGTSRQKKKGVGLMEKLWAEFPGSRLGVTRSGGGKSGLYARLGGGESTKKSRGKRLWGFRGERAEQNNLVMKQKRSLRALRGGSQRGVERAYEDQDKNTR